MILGGVLDVERTDRVAVEAELHRSCGRCQGSGEITRQAELRIHRRIGEVRRRGVQRDQGNWPECEALCLWLIEGAIGPHAERHRNFDGVAAGPVALDFPVRTWRCIDVLRLAVDTDSEALAHP